MADWLAPGKTGKFTARWPRATVSASCSPSRMDENTDNLAEEPHWSGSTNQRPQRCRLPAERCKVLARVRRAFRPPCGASRQQKQFVALGEKSTGGRHVGVEYDRIEYDRGKQV